MRHSIVFVMLSALLFSGASHALDFYDAKPKPGSYIGGGPTVFSVNITNDTLDTARANLYIISKNAFDNNEAWDNYSLACTGNPYVCSKNLSFVIAGSDTLEYFYFEARNSSGFSYFGNSTIPYIFTLDRNPPTVIFTRPAEGSYAIGAINITIMATDTASGANQSSIEYSFDNATWLNATNGTAVWNTSSHADNSTVLIYGRARDNVRNIGFGRTNTTVENERPQLNVSSPQNGSSLFGVAQFSASVRDAYSGVDVRRVSVSLAGQVSLLQCSNQGASAGCTVLIDTSGYADGAYNATFMAFDVAGNSNATNISVTLVNTQPVITLLVADNSYIAGVIAVNATVNRPNVMTAVTFSGAGSAAMSCSADFRNCSHTVDTKTLADGSYTFTASGSTIYGYSVQDSSPVTIDNSRPSASISAPSLVRGSVTVSVSAADANIRTGAVFSPAGFQPASCTSQSGSMSCSSTLDSTKLPDGINELSAAVSDLAGNAAVARINATADNTPPVFASMKINQTTGRPPATIGFTVSINDSVSGMNSSKVTLRIPNAQLSLALVEVAAGVWYGSARIGSAGRHDVDVDAEDKAGNAAYFANKGYFYLGDLDCGNGVCNADENHCICASDCSKPACTGYIECGSGLPVCTQYPTGSPSSPSTSSPGSSTPGRVDDPGSSSGGRTGSGRGLTAFSSCGDSICSSVESCATCSSDCGACPLIEGIDKESAKQPSTKSGSWDFPSVSLPGNSDTLVIGAAVAIAAVLGFIYYKFYPKQKYKGESFLPGK